MFSVNVAKPVPLNAPFVDAILIGLVEEVEFDLPDGILFGDVLPGASFVEDEDAVLQRRAMVSRMPPSPRIALGTYPPL